MSGTIVGTLDQGIILNSSSTYSSPTTIAATIVAPGNAISALQDWILVNDGNVESTGGNGVFLKAGGMIANDGTIIADAQSQYGVFGSNASVSVQNDGLISGGNSGVLLATGTVGLDNQISGTIEGGTIGVRFSGFGPDSSSLINAGTIESTGAAGYGVTLSQAAGINMAGGLISGTKAGVEIGVYSSFQNEGTITGQTGIMVTGNLDSIAVSGTVSGSTGTAILFTAAAGSGNPPDILTLLPGAVLNGSANGGGVADVVLAGSGGMMANVGSALTNFLGVTVASGASWELADVSTMSGIATLENDGRIQEASGDFLTVNATVTGPGIFDLSSGTLALNNNVNAGAIVEFSGTGSTLLLSSTHVFAGEIAGFQSGDTIELTGLGLSTTITGTLDVNVMTLSGAMGPETITFASDPGALLVAPIIDGPGSQKAYEIVTAPCFRAGTNLLTPQGPRAVETLRKGDLLVTHGGAVRPIVWHGQRRVDCRRHVDPESVWPILIEAGAFGRGVPSRDLYVSPDHALFSEGVLIPAKLLANGISIRQVATDTVTYHHIELQTHDVVWAETLPAETYLECNNRHHFSGQGKAIALFASFEPPQWDAARACAELVTEGDTLALIRRRLQARLIETGFWLGDGKFRVRADGRTIGSGRPGIGQHRYTLPHGAAAMTIESTFSRPAEIDPASPDRRRLGIALIDVAADGKTLGRDDPRFGGGFHGAERSGRRWFRWTDGAASFDVRGLRELVFTVQAMAPVWRSRDDRPADWRRESSAASR